MKNKKSINKRLISDQNPKFSNWIRKKYGETYQIKQWIILKIFLQRLVNIKVNNWIGIEIWNRYKEAFILKIGFYSWLNKSYWY